MTNRGASSAFAHCSRKRPRPTGSAIRATRSASIQQRLRDYGYYDEEPTGFYGTQTVHAVSAFKAANGLDADGAADALTCELLDGDNATARAVYEQMLADEETASRRGTSLVTALTYAPDALAGSAQVEVWDEKSESYVELADGQTYDPNALIPHSEETVAAETVVNTGDPKQSETGRRERARRRDPDPSERTRLLCRRVGDELLRHDDADGDL